MSESLVRIVAIALGGALGAITRYGAGLFCVRVFGERFPFGTLLVNVVGCFLLGLLMHEFWLLAEEVDGKTKHTSPIWHSGVAVGLLGGLTTFSTFGYQTIRHVEQGEFGFALLNVASNLLLGLLAVFLGLGLARYLTS